jgi:hypothetical protein
MPIFASVASAVAGPVSVSTSLVPLNVVVLDNVTVAPVPATAQTKVAKELPFFAIVNVVDAVAAVPAVPELPPPPDGNEQAGGINLASSSVFVIACSAVKIKFIGKPLPLPDDAAINRPFASTVMLAWV